MSSSKKLPRKQVLYKLTEKEIADPNLVIDELFDFIHLPAAREMLWEWLKCTVTGSYHKTLTSSERAGILCLYEKMEKLIEAAHVLHEKKHAGEK